MRSHSFIEKRGNDCSFYMDVRSACVKRTRGTPARGHERTSFISGLEESVARFDEKNAEKSDGWDTQKSESSRSATDTAADYECIVRRINNGRTTGDTAKPIVPSTSVFFFFCF